MGEILVQPVFFKIVAGDRVGIVPRHARRNAFLHQRVRRKNVRVYFLEFFVLFVVAEQKRARTVGTIPLRFATEINEHRVAEPQAGFPRFVMRNTAVRAERDNRIERNAFRAERAHFVFEKSCGFALAHALFDLRQQSQESIFRNVARAGDQRKFAVGFRKHGAFERFHAIDQFQPLFFQRFRARKIDKGIRHADSFVSFDQFKRSGIGTFPYLDALCKMRLPRRLDITRIDDENAFFCRQDDVTVGRIKSREIAAQEILLDKKRVGTGILINYLQIRRKHIHIIAKSPF